MKGETSPSSIADYACHRLDFCRIARDCSDRHYALEASKRRQRRRRRQWRRRRRRRRRRQRRCGDGDGGGERVAAKKADGDGVQFARCATQSAPLATLLNFDASTRRRHRHRRRCSSKLAPSNAQSRRAASRRRCRKTRVFRSHQALFASFTRQPPVTTQRSSRKPQRSPPVQNTRRRRLHSRQRESIVQP